MPPGSPPPSNAGQSTEHADPYYSNEDVEILHNIVVLAQELLPNLPERERLPTNALFNAYYDILPRVGINADHDSRYARILFKIGGLRGPGTLYEKFEEVLARMGIEIEFDQDEDDSRLEDSQTEQELPTTGETSPQDENQEPQPRPRRNSESSAWDLVYTTHSNSKKRHNSFSSVDPHKLSIADERRMLQELITDQQARGRAKEAPKDHNASTNVKNWLSPRSEKSHQRRSRSVSNHGSVRVRRRSPPAPATPNPASDDYHGASEFTSTTTNYDEDTFPRIYDSSRTAAYYEEPSALMQIKASKIHQNNLAVFARLQLRRWKEKAVQAQERNAQLDQIASQHDRQALLHSAFDSWRSCFVQEREAAEEREFYEDLERRAQMMRDMNIVKRIFARWLSETREQVQRTNRARDHMVRRRVFSAWKDVTAANELKVRKQVLKKFFGSWRSRYSSNAEANEAAVHMYEGNLVEKIYRQWVYKMWEAKASDWRADNLKRQTLYRWIDRTHHECEENRIVHDERSLELVRNAWRIWRAKTENRIRMNQQAENLYKGNLLRNVVQKLRRETEVIPAKNTLQTEVSSRLLREAFATWQKRAQQEKQAAAVDRTKILREALTQWRLKTRARELSHRVNERVLQKSVKNWVLATREKYAYQQTRHKSLQQVLQLWKSKQQALTEQRLEREKVAQSFAARTSENLVLRQWYSRMETKQRNEIAAVDFYAPRLVRSVMNQWTDQLQRVQKLEQRSRDADYYFLASRSLKAWKDATEASKREKRKAAYAQVRRNHKMNLARGVLKMWQSKVQPLLELQAQASEVAHNKRTVLAAQIFDRWRGRAEEVSELNTIAQENVLKKQFTVWRERSNALQELGIEATMTYQEQQEGRALKKWNLKMLQLRAQANYAVEIREKNTKRNFRKIFLYWHQQAVERRPPKPRPPRHGSLKAGEMSKSVRFETPAKETGWLDTGQEHEVDEWASRLDGVAVSTPLPGYLNTPSKRSERVTAAAARYSTTPKAPLSTPYEKQLRAQWSDGLLPPQRRTPRRSTLGLGGGFPDIPERKKPPDLSESTTNYDYESRRAKHM